jgi:methionyl aminopeptidase
LTQCSFDSLYLGIEAIRPYGEVVDIGRAIQRFAEARGFSVVRDYQGHGIGRRFHQDPGIPHYPDRRFGSVVIEPGVCFTIEPMVNLGTWKVVLDQSDGWTVRTADGSLSAQFEHTILMTEEGPEILTLTVHGPQKGHRF